MYIKLHIIVVKICIKMRLYIEICGKIEESKNFFVKTLAFL